MKVTGSERTLWPVLEFDNSIIWMRGVELESPPGIRVQAVPLESSADSTPRSPSV